MPCTLHDLGFADLLLTRELLFFEFSAREVEPTKPPHPLTRTEPGSHHPRGTPHDARQAADTTLTATGPMVAVSDLRRSFGSGERAVHALRGIDFSIERGELTALKGRSGSGKTTLL